jgi:DNA-binding LytR/AlgR family response regulator
MTGPRALIADDEPHLASYLQARLKVLWPELEVIAVSPNGVQALADIAEHEPDIAFLDIKMPGLTGLEVAQRADVPLHLVFVTAFDQYAVEAFEREAVDYLLKPVTDERLEQTVRRLRERIGKREPPPGVRDALAELARWLPGQPAGVAPNRLAWIRAAVGNQVRLIPVEEVCYFQANDKYVSVFTAEGESLIRLTLRELLDQLDPDRFWQIHRGTVVNLGHVATTLRDLRGRVTLKLKSRSESLVVSRAFAHLFKQM